VAREASAQQIVRRDVGGRDLSDVANWLDAAVGLIYSLKLWVNLASKQHSAPSAAAAR